MPSSNSSPSLLSTQLGASPFSFLDEVTERFRTVWDSRVPEGYEDDTGFHFGPVGDPLGEGQNWLGEHI